MKTVNVVFCSSNREYSNFTPLLREIITYKKREAVLLKSDEQFLFF